MKALIAALVLSLVSTVVCLALAYPLAMILASRHVSQQQLYRPDFHPSHVDELSAAHPGMADAAGEKRRHQLGILSFLASARP